MLWQQRVQQHACLLCGGALLSPSHRHTCMPSGCAKASREAAAAGGMQHIRRSAVSACPALSLAASSCCTARASTVFMPWWSGSAAGSQASTRLCGSNPYVRVTAQESQQWMYVKLAQAANVCTLSGSQLLQATEHKRSWHRAQEGLAQSVDILLELLSAPVEVTCSRCIAAWHRARAAARSSLWSPAYLGW